MGSKHGHNDHHRFHRPRTVQAVGFKTALTREHVWACDVLSVLWGRHAIVPAMPIVDYGVNVLAKPFPKAPPARDRDFTIAPQSYLPQLLPPSSIAATRLPAFRHRTAGVTLIRDFLHYPHSTQEPHDNGIDRAVYPMRRRLYFGRPYGSYFDPLIAPESFDVRLSRCARPKPQCARLVLLRSADPVVNQCLQAPYNNGRGRRSSFDGVDIIPDYGCGLSPEPVRGKPHETDRWTGHAPRVDISNPCACRPEVPLPSVSLTNQPPRLGILTAC